MPTVVEAVVQTLVAYDTEIYFCVTGGDHDLWVALDDAGIRIVNCRSESAAAYMADGYARVSGRPGFVYGQRGPGAANVASALADALWALSPVVSLTSSIALEGRDRYQYQDVDTLALHAPVTTWNRTLASPRRAGAMVRAAIRAATGPVPGPVHLEIPADMLKADAGPEAAFREDGAGRTAGRRPLPDPADVVALVDALANAQRPLIVAGNGVVISEAWDELRALAETLDIPVATTLGGKGSIATDHPLSVGVVGRYSAKVANDTLRAADTVLAIGTRLGGLASHGWKLPFDQKRLLQVDTDGQVIGHNFRVDVGVVGDAQITLRLAAEAARGRDPRPDGDSWTRTVADQVATWRTHAQALADQQPDDGIHPAAVLAELRTAMAPEDLLVADTGAIAAWSGTLFPVPAGRTLVRSAGSLGWALPGALGAALAAPERRTVALSGDGGLLYHIGELETAVRNEIPVPLVVLNNRAFASEYHLLKHGWGRDIPAVIDFHDVDFAAVAEGFGVRGSTVTDIKDLPDALREAIACGQPALVDVRVSKQAESPSEARRGDSPV